jgi:hypothetical protein
MTRLTKTLLPLCALLLLVVQVPSPAQEPLPDNVAGNWIISAHNANGTTDRKTISLRQNGNILAGHFQGPHQSGSLNGTIDVHHIVFRTNTHIPLTFRGRVDANTIDGTFSIQGKTGEFHAWRQRT